MRRIYITIEQAKEFWPDETKEFWSDNVEQKRHECVNPTNGVACADFKGMLVLVKSLEDGELISVVKFCPFCGQKW